MKQFFGLLCLLGCMVTAQGQDIHQRLNTAVQKLLGDSQMKHAILGLSVVNSATGEKIFGVNEQAGLAPASCQKIITAATILDMFGTSYRYETVLGYDGKINGGVLKGNLYLVGSGDPSIGSWRYASTQEYVLRKAWAKAIASQHITRIDGHLVGYAGRFESDITPGGWIWDDIGNYYGAGISGLNWHENQYDLLLRSGDQTGSPVSIVATRPKPAGVQLVSELRAAAKGSGDNAYIYLAPYTTNGVVRGTIPAGEKAFTISGSLPDPALQAVTAVRSLLDSLKIPVRKQVTAYAKDTPVYNVLYRYQSPALDSLVYWFLKKSINLYGESFLRTIAYEKNGFGAADKGLQLLRDHWKTRGIESSALHMVDGSGLSPQNRITTDALVKVLQYARGRDWFGAYYDALPVYNQMKLKSGTIGGAKSFAGYHTARDGKTYTVAIIINNYDGSAGEIVKKMFAVLDELK